MHYSWRQSHSVAGMEDLPLEGGAYYSWYGDVFMEGGSH